jgi:hypothetical protein
MSELKPLVNDNTNYPYYYSDVMVKGKNHDEVNDCRGTINRRLLLFIASFGSIMILLHVSWVAVNTINVKTKGNNNYNNYSTLRGSQRLVYSSTVLNLNLYKNASVSGRYYISDSNADDVDNLLVEGQYDLDVGHNGWNYLTVEAPSSEHHDDDSDQGSDHEEQHQYLRTMSAVGFMEGYLTCHEMMDWYTNMYNGLFADGSISIESLHFLESNHRWMKEQADRYWLVDDYWLSVQGLLSQLDGLLEGTRGGCSTYPTKHHRAYSSHAHAQISSMHTDEDDHYYNGIYLPSFGTEGDDVQLIHLLIANSNGDLFQIESSLRGTVGRSRRTCYTLHLLIIAIDIIAAHQPYTVCMS